MSAFAVGDDTDDLSSLPEPDYDHLDLSFHDGEEKEFCGGNDEESFSKQTDDMFSQYILGTLIVRVVAARDLEAVNKAGLGQILFGGSSARRSTGRAPTQRSRPMNHANSNGGTSNPYASLTYCGQTQRTSDVYGTTDPIWPRGETLFFDVSLPVPNLVQENADDDDNDKESGSLNVAGLEKVGSLRDSLVEKEDPLKPVDSTLPTVPLPPQPQKPVMSIALFHAEDGSVQPQKKYNPTKGGETWADLDTRDEPFLGMASVDLTHVLTGKVAYFDEWLPLTGTENPRGMVRIVCEYEATDPPPRPGDMVRFTSFCHPADLYPIPSGRTFLVTEVDGDDVMMSFKSPEGWQCSFSAHRFTLICEERNQAAIEKYQDQLAIVADRIAHSPLVSVVTKTVERVPDDGLVSVGADAVKEGASLLGRWVKGGVGTVVGDIVYATNWDGQHDPNPDELEDADDDGLADELTQEGHGVDGTSVASLDAKDALPGMPCCPITGEPMRDPVVAADGHTYERSAISRWLHTSDKSPLTGLLLPHKELVPNYVLLSSIEAAQASLETKESS